MSLSSPVTPEHTREKRILISSIFIAGLCSIVYELLISTTSSYFLGDSVKQFSLTIGIYMAAMGVGSYLSRFFQKDLLYKFIWVEIILGLIGGSSVPMLYFFYAYFDNFSFQVFMFALITIIGILTGLEIPLLTLIMKKHYPLKINLSNVLSMDYLGALLATILFPFFLLPFLGTFKSSVLFGLINLGIGFLNLWYFSSLLNLKQKRVCIMASVVITLFFATVLFFANFLMGHWSNLMFRDPIIYNQQSKYQNIVLTKGNLGLRLYLNKTIQFSSQDEYRYHECLVHPALLWAESPKKVLVLGGGEGLVVREILKHEAVESITIVDLDEAMFDLAMEHPLVKALNEESLVHPKVKRVVADAFVFLQNNKREQYDVIISDLPDPTSEGIARLYSRSFFKLIRQHLHPEGIFITQATSPWDTDKAFWCIAKTLEVAGLSYIYPFHAVVPSFGGEWGFIVAANHPLEPQNINFNIDTRFLDNRIFPKLFAFEKDLLPPEIEHNTLDRPILLHYYLEEWRGWSKVK